MNSLNCKLKKTGVLAVLLLAIIAVRAETDREVYPTGQFPTDVQNVQSAVDRGGSILLKATNVAGEPTPFNFGSPELLPGRTVYLNTNIKIRGERVGQVTTRIQGGAVPFLGVAAVHTVIRGIHFDGPLNSAITVVQSTGSEIVGNRVTGVVGYMLFFGLTEGRGIKFLGNSDPDGAISGRIRVLDNVFENLHADLSDAIVFDAVAADIEVSRNTVRTVESSGVFVINSKASVSIKNNVIEPGPGLYSPDYSTGNGIMILGSRGASFDISRNNIACENPWADGILLMGDTNGIDSPMIKANEIIMQNSLFGAITLNGGILDAYVVRNRLSGNGAFALDTFGAPDQLVRSTTYRANDISGFDATIADVFFDEFTHDSVFIGDCGMIIDLGVNNQTAGCSDEGNISMWQSVRRDPIARRNGKIQSSLIQTVPGKSANGTIAVAEWGLRDGNPITYKQRFER